MPHTLPSLKLADNEVAELTMLCGFDDDLAGQITQTRNRIRGLLTQTHPALKRVVGLELRALVDERPTFSYRRITVLVNRARRKAGLASVNHKRIYRLMSRHGLLRQRYTGRPPDRAHDGIIRTIHPNSRWTSDGSQIPCSDQAVHVAFSLDTCDREIISWCAGTGAISGEMIRDLMLQAWSSASV